LAGLWRFLLSDRVWLLAGLWRFLLSDGVWLFGLLAGLWRFLLSDRGSGRGSDRVWLFGLLAHHLHKRPLRHSTPLRWRMWRITCVL